MIGIPSTNFFAHPVKKCMYASDHLMLYNLFSQVVVVGPLGRQKLSEAGLGPGGVCHKLTSKSLNALFEDSTFVDS